MARGTCIDPGVSLDPIVMADIPWVFCGIPEAHVTLRRYVVARVLIVDDVEIVRKALQVGVQKMGHYAEAVKGTLARYRKSMRRNA